LDKNVIFFGNTWMRLLRRCAPRKDRNENSPHNDKRKTPSPLFMPA